MNLAQAQAIAESYEDLISKIPHDKIELPNKSYPSQDWKISNLDNISIEDGALKFNWSYYSCGETDYTTTYMNLDEFFN